MAEANVDEVTSPDTGLVTRDQLKVESLESERRTRSYVDVRFDKREGKLDERFARIVCQNWLAMTVLVIGLIVSVLAK